MAILAMLGSPVQSDGIPLPDVCTPARQYSTTQQCTKERGFDCTYVLQRVPVLCDVPVGPTDWIDYSICANYWLHNVSTSVKLTASFRIYLSIVRSVMSPK